MRRQQLLLLLLLQLRRRQLKGRRRQQALRGCGCWRQQLLLGLLKLGLREQWYS
jgi:hypothetical protein